MIVLDGRDLTRRYGARVVLAGVSLSLRAGERVGVVGANGSGKSTLGRILGRVEEADAGELVLRRGTRVAYLPQEPTFEGDPPAREAVVAGMRDWSEACARHAEASAAIDGGDASERWVQAQADAAAAVERLGGWGREHDADAFLSALGLEGMNQRVSTLSGGERRRVDLARTLIAQPDVAILDEPTNHLDVESIEWLEGWLRDVFRGASLVITHDRAFLDRVVERTAELHEGHLTVYSGGYEAYLEAKAERDAHEARTEQKRQNILRRELEWLRRSAPARTSKQKARVDRAETALAEKRPSRSRTVALRLDSPRTGKTVLTLEDLSLRIGGRPLVDALTLIVQPGDRIGVMGPSGCGKTTLLRAVLGERAPDGGRVVHGKNTQVTYVGQDRAGLDEEGTVLDNVAGGRMKVDVGGRSMDVRSYLERFLFDADRLRQRVSSLSGGEKARVLLAKRLLSPANLLVLDEPTNDLDIATLSALEQMLVEMNGTALFVTHDRWFLDRVATSTLVFEEDGRVVRYPGGYTIYRTLRNEARERERAELRARESEGRTGPTAAPRKKKALTYGEELELAAIFDDIAAAEAKVAELEAALADPSGYASDREAAERLARDHAAAEARLSELLERWETLEAKASGSGEE